jgi:hypothetical protein
VHEIVVGLAAMTGRLPQLFAQLASWLLAEGRVGRVAPDGGDDARQQSGQVIASLSDATAAVHEVAAGLAEAANSAVGLTAIPNASAGQCAATRVLDADVVTQPQRWVGKSDDVHRQTATHCLQK